MAGKPIQYTTMEVKERLKESDDPAVSAREIAKEMECSHSTVLKRLDELQGSDEVKGKEVGANAKVWWLVG